LDILHNFNKLVRNTPEILQCYHVTGASDFVFTVAVADMPEYNDFIKMFFARNQDVRDYISMLVLSKVKFETAMEPVENAKGNE
jgi:DNA-binding Lrp family transcriptional regulator